MWKCYKCKVDVEEVDDIKIFYKDLSLPDACGYPLYLTVYYACAVLAVWAGLYALSFLQRRVRSKRRKILIAFR